MDYWFKFYLRKYFEFQRSRWKMTIYWWIKIKLVIYQLLTIFSEIGHWKILCSNLFRFRMNLRQHPRLMVFLYFFELNCWMGIYFLQFFLMIFSVPFYVEIQMTSILAFLLISEHMSQIPVFRVKFIVFYPSKNE